MPVSASAAQTVGDRLRECARRVGTIEKLATLAGVPRRSLEDYISGIAEMKASRLFAIASAAGVSPVWLQIGQHGDDSVNATRPERGGDVLADIRERLLSDFILIGPLRPFAANGTLDLPPAVDHPTTVALLRNILPQSLIDVATNLRALSMPDDSMGDTIRANDLVVINVAVRSVDKDGIYAYLMEERPYIKRLQRRPGGVVTAHSDNRRYGAIDLATGEHLQILGQVVWSGGPL